MTKILVIEDEDMFRGDVVDWLTLEGYEVFTAADGVEGTNTAVLGDHAKTGARVMGRGFERN